MGFPDYHIGTTLDIPSTFCDLFFFSRLVACFAVQMVFFLLSGTTAAAASLFFVPCYLMWACFDILRRVARLVGWYLYFLPHWCVSVSGWFFLLTSRSLYI
ncbi:uncharacterized protein YALI1_A18426g [Yarrowia lipolytica]|uniref:Uncharacterized protein n=1 Tax=Yarrowia lipolytica TaxID=4952 RepID=A0A1D8N5A5_YARLL|nr:hypothetical protein YALI1_A18426g [Yarrowia lipolytica]